MNCCRFGAVATFAALLLGSLPAEAQQTLTISSWGGAYQKAQREAWFEVVEKELGIKIKEDTTSGIADVRAQVASGRPTWDLVQQGNYTCAILDKEGKVEKLDRAILAMEGISPNMKGEGWISNLVYSAALCMERREVQGEEAGEMGRPVGCEDLPRWAHDASQPGLQPRSRLDRRWRSNGQALSARR